MGSRLNSRDGTREFQPPCGFALAVGAPTRSARSHSSTSSTISASPRIASKADSLPNQLRHWPFATSRAVDVVQPLLPLRYPPQRDECGGQIDVAAIDEPTAQFLLLAQIAQCLRVVADFAGRLSGDGIRSSALVLVEVPSRVRRGCPRLRAPSRASPAGCGRQARSTPSTSGSPSPLCGAGVFVHLLRVSPKGRIWRRGSSTGQGLGPIDIGLGCAPLPRPTDPFPGYWLEQIP